MGHKCAALYFTSAVLVQHGSKHDIIVKLFSTHLLAQNFNEEETCAQ